MRELGNPGESLVKPFPIVYALAELQVNHVVNERNPRLRVVLAGVAAVVIRYPVKESPDPMSEVFGIVRIVRDSEVHQFVVLHVQSPVGQDPRHVLRLVQIFFSRSEVLK